MNEPKCSCWAFCNKGPEYERLFLLFLKHYLHWKFFFSQTLPQQWQWLYSPRVICHKWQTQLAQKVIKPVKPQSQYRSKSPRYDPWLFWNCFRAISRSSWTGSARQNWPSWRRSWTTARSSTRPAWLRWGRSTTLSSPTWCQTYETVFLCHCWRDHISKSVCASTRVGTGLTCKY